MTSSVLNDLLQTSQENCAAALATLATDEIRWPCNTKELTYAAESMRSGIDETTQRKQMWKWTDAK